MPRRRRDRRGQAAVEFALVMPLLALSAVLVLVVLQVCLASLRLDDAARRAARIAAAARNPSEAATRVVPPGTRVVVRVDDARGLVTVELSRSWTTDVPLVGRWLPAPRLTAEATTVLEPPIVIG